MIIKGIVEEYINRNNVKVRVPQLHGIESDSSSVKTIDLPNAVMCTLPNCEIELSTNDIVWVKFENLEWGKPVIVGFLDIKSNSKIILNAAEMVVSDRAQLPLDTTIENVGKNSIQCLSNLSTNVNDYINKTNRVAVIDLSPYSAGDEVPTSKINNIPDNAMLFAKTVDEFHNEMYFPLLEKSSNQEPENIDVKYMTTIPRPNYYFGNSNGVVGLTTNAMSDDADNFNNYYLTKQTLAEYKANKNIFIGHIGTDVKPAGIHTIISQTWKGYRYEDFFNGSIDRPDDLISFQDFGSGVRDGACGVCSIMAARDWMMGVTDIKDKLTISEMWGNYKLPTPGSYSYGEYFMSNGSIRYGDYRTPDTRCCKLGRFNASSEYKRRSGNTTQADFSKIYDSSLVTQLSRPNSELAEMFYKPVDGDEIYFDRYSWDKAHGVGNFVSMSEDFRANQVRAMMIVKYELSKGRPIMIFFNSRNMNQHFVLASGYEHKHGSYYSLDDITVLDPCPQNRGTTYLGVEISLPQALARISGDISDGICRLYKFYYRDERRNINMG